ncbi:MAG: hypothetical protein AAGJ95_00175 [Cyanobacteria bacterium J06554_11]
MMRLIFILLRGGERDSPKERLRHRIIAAFENNRYYKYYAPQIFSFIIFEKSGKGSKPNKFSNG